MAHDLDFPDHLGSKCTDRVLMNVARPRNAIDILEYGTQDLLYNVHTDIVIVTAEQRKIGIHACVINSASSVVRNLMSSVSNPGLKQVIFLPDFSSETVENLRGLLYGSSVVLSKEDIKNLNLLNNVLDIHQKINIVSANPAPSTNINQNEAKERDIESYNIKSRDKTMLGQIEITRNHRGSHQEPQRKTDNSNLLARQNCDISNSVYWERSQQTETQNNNVTLIDQNSDSLSCQPNLYILHNDGKTISHIGFETPQESSNDKEADEQDVPDMEKQVFMQQVQLGRNHHVDGYWMEETDFIDDLMNKNNEDNVIRKKNDRHKINVNRPVRYGIIDSDQTAGRDIRECDGETTDIYSNEENEGTISASDDAQYTSQGDDMPAPQSPDDQNATVATTQLTESLQEETVKTVGNEDIGDCNGGNQEDDEELPLLCWYCNKEFHSFQSLCDHINTHSGSSKFSRRHHRCPRCGEVLHSTWKLRQHLTTHHTEKSTNKEDHQYAERPRKTKTVSKPKGDHGYATITVCKQNEQTTTKKECARARASTVKRKEVSKDEADEVSTDDGSAKRKRRRMKKIVCTEHSYGTTRDSSPETEQTGEHKDRSDHAYSNMHAPSLTTQINQQQIDAENKPTSTNITEDATTDILQNDDKVPTDIAKFETSRQAKNVRRKLKKSRIFPCGQCVKSFPQKYRLNRHVREVHDKEKLFMCEHEQCSAKFFKSSSLLRHMVSVHIEYRPYNCKMCTAAFKDNKALKYHEENKVCQSTNYKVKLEKLEVD